MVHAIPGSTRAATARQVEREPTKDAAETKAETGQSAKSEFEGTDASGGTAEHRRTAGLRKEIDADTKALKETNAKLEAGEFATPADKTRAEENAATLRARISSNSAALDGVTPKEVSGDSALSEDLGLQLDLVKQGAPGGKAGAPLKSSKAAAAGTAAKADAKAEVFAHRALRLGAEGADVKELTTHLANQKPPLLSEPTSTFTPEVKDAVEKYQSKKALQVDGIVGEQTWGAMHGVKLPPGVSNLRPASAKEITAHAETAGPVKEAAAGAAAKEAAATGETAVAEGADATAKGATAEKAAKTPEEPSIVDGFVNWVTGLFSSGSDDAANSTPAQTRPPKEAVDQFVSTIQSATVSPADAKEAIAMYRENDKLAHDYASAFKGGAEGLAAAGKPEAAAALSGVGDAAASLNTAGAARAATQAHHGLSRYMVANAEKILMSDPKLADAMVTGNGVTKEQLADITDPTLKRLATNELEARTKFENESAKAAEVVIGIEAGKDGFLDANEIGLLNALREQNK